MNVLGRSAHACRGLVGLLFLGGFLQLAGLRGAPVITRQPVNATVTAGQNATFTVAATGTGTRSYQWRRSGFPIFGATTNTLVLGATKRDEAGFYDVVISDSTGSVTSDVASLFVRPTSYPTNIAADPSWDLQLETEVTVNVNAIAVLPDGGFFAAGRFASVNGTRRASIARINADGSVNTSFVPADIPAGEILTLALQPDGKILIGGQFERVGGVLRRALARLNADGSLDSLFNASISAGAYVTKVVVEATGKILVGVMNGGQPLRRLNPDGSLERNFSMPMALSLENFIVQGDGKVIATNVSSSLINGQVLRPLYRFHPDGSLDASFNAIAPDSGSPLALALDRSGRLLIGGNFVDHGFPGITGVARLSANGELDSSFRAVVNGNGVAAFVVRPDDEILVGGSFDRVNGAIRYNIARLNSDGTLDSFAPPPNFNSVRTIAMTADGSLLLGSQHFYESNGPGAGLLRLRSNGTFDNSIASIAIRAPGTVTALTTLADGRTFVFGNFDYLRGTPMPGIARLDATGAVDASFNPGVGANGEVTAALTLPDGRIAIAGAFGGYDGEARAQVALLTSDGRIDQSFNPPPGLFARASRIGLLPSGKLVISGYTFINNIPEGRVHVFNLDGTLAWPASGRRFDREVYCLAVQADGKIVLGGAFTALDGAKCEYLARLNDDGTFDAAFSNETRCTGLVQDVALSPSGKIVVAGFSSQYDNAAYYGLVRLNPDGTRDSGFAQQMLVGVTCILVQEDEKIIFRASTSAWDGSDAGLNRLNADGSFDSTFRAAGFVATNYQGAQAMLRMRENGQLLMSDGNSWASQFVGTGAAAAPIFVLTPTEQRVTPGAFATLRTTVQSLAPVTYQWLFNGSPILGATTDTHVVSNLGVVNVGEYSVRVASEFGSITSPPVLVDAPLYLRGRLVNLSIRSAVRSGSGTLIMGTVLGGAGTGGNKRLLMRAAGPTLASSFGLSTAVSDTRLELYDSGGSKIDENDDWDGVFEFESVGAFPFSPPVRDAAIYYPLMRTGAYSLHVHGKNNTTGIALAEIYDASPTDAFTTLTPRLINGSARTWVGIGDDVLILGFVVSGRQTVRVLVRAAGPTLSGSPYNVPDILSDPKLELYDAVQRRIASNDNWGDDNGALALTDAFTAAGAFSFSSVSSKDAALIANLAPGLYTAVVRGVGEATGVALVELYELP